MDGSPFHWRRTLFQKYFAVFSSRLPFRWSSAAFPMRLLQITNIPREVLGRSIGSLADEDVRIFNALDALFSRAWR
jgi:hypothetical protein